MVVLKRMSAVERKVFRVSTVMTPLLLILLWPGSVPPAAEGATQGKDSVQVTAERFNFTPARLQARKGVPLQIELKSEDTYHGFRIPAADLDVTIPARGRGSVVVEFRSSAPGRYSFECSRPCGAGHTMMRGVIVVE